MLFNSLTYAVFFAIVLAVYWRTQGNRARLAIILLSSLTFYAAWNPPFVLLLCLSIVVDFTAGRRMASDPRRKKAYLLLSVFTNLGILTSFKYGEFLLENSSYLLRLAGLEDFEPAPMSAILPLGISFYTFQTMSYSIDIYRGELRPMDSILKFAAYVTFFPQLVAGPIVRAAELEPQLSSSRTIDHRQFFAGSNRILVGLLKKVVIADWLAVLVEPVFATPELYTGLAVWIAVFAYAFQIFLDFSGYVDIALGSAQLLGFRLPENFAQPYLAVNITEFWRRWHMTLSTWLRDYLYIPLGGNRGGRYRTYRNLILTMLLGGLWHGASWNFVIWGGIHGSLLAVHRLWRARKASVHGASGGALSILGTFHVVCLAWVFFRCPTFDLALRVLSRIFSVFTEFDSDLVVACLLGASILVVYRGATAVRQRVLAWYPTHVGSELAYGLCLGLSILVLSTLAAPTAEFIYFVF